MPRCHVTSTGLLALKLEATLFVIMVHCVACHCLPLSKKHFVGGFICNSFGNKIRYANISTLDLHDSLES